MEVLPKPAAVLTNVEVLATINQLQQTKHNRKTAGNFKLQGSEWIVNQVKRYLRGTDSCKQTPEDVTNFFKRLETTIPKPFTRNELVQFTNLRPTTLVEIHAMVDDCDGRFTEDEITQLLDLISTTLPARPKKANTAH